MGKKLEAQTLEISQKTMEEQHSNYEDDEEDEILSLCDLSIYSSDAPDYVNRGDLTSSSSSSSSSTSSSSSYDHDYFEFSSGHLTAQISLPHNIIFCGKFITCKEPNTNSTQLKKKEKKSKKKKKKGGMFRFSLRKVSLAARSRWNLLMFGLIRVPTKKIEMGEMKRRQSHRRAVPVEKRREREEKRENGNGVWRMIRALGCGSLTSSSPSSDMAVKASVAACCMPKL